MSRYQHFQECREHGELFCLIRMNGTHRPISKFELIEAVSQHDDNLAIEATKDLEESERVDNQLEDIHVERQFKAMNECESDK